MPTRELSEVSATELAWFQPGLDRLAALKGDPDARVGTFFSPEAPVFLARAPGRLDVMGGIADYSGALVLELPLDRSTLALAQRQAAPSCDFITRRAGRWESFQIEAAPLVDGALATTDALREWFASRPRDRWAAYLAGVVQACLQARPGQRTPGIRILVDSAVPDGKGVASSAALEVATMFAVAACYGVSMDPLEMALACQRVENNVVGAPCGVMDQVTSACGSMDRLLRLRCQPGTIEGHTEIPAGYRFFGIDSGVRHDVSAAEYGTVRTAAFMGYRMMADVAELAVRQEDDRVRVEDPRWRGYLANVTPREFQDRFELLLPEQMAGAEFLDRYGGITDSVTRVLPDRRYPVRQATAHPIGEQERVRRFIDLLDRLPGSPTLAPAIGELMYASHRSYGACGLGSEGTDRLVALVAAAGPERGLYGAKITGGGSGGTVAVLGREGAQPEVEAIAARYARDSARVAEVFTRSGPGAAETGVLRLQLG